jgi:hypothetical protein
MGSPHDDLRAIANSLACSGESYYVEFKTAWDYRPEGRAPRDPKEIAADIGKTLVAFANADGGDLLIGVEDNGSVTGIPHAEAHLDYLKSWRQQLRADDGAEPSVRVAELELQGQRILLFRVEPTGGPPVVTADGRCLIRQKAASVPVPPAFIERRRAHISGDQAYEAEPVPGASISDLDWELIRAALAAANAPLQAFDEAALLRYWNLIEQRNGAITLRRAALLLFAREPLRWHPNNRLRVRHVHGQAPGFGRGEREMAADNKSLASFELSPIPPAPRGVPQVEVRFEIDADGIVHVHAKDLGTGREQKVRVVASSGLTKEQIDGIVNDADKYKQSDSKRKELAELKQSAEALLYTSERAVTEFGDIATPELLESVKADIAGLRASIDGGDAIAIRESLQRLELSAYKMAESMYGS